VTAPPAEGRPRLLLVANKQLPEGDYRRRFAASSGRYDTILAMPGGGDGAVALGFGEGLGRRDLLAAVRLWRLLGRRDPAFDVAHFSGPKLAMVGPVLAAGRGVRSVVSITGLGRVFTEDGAAVALLRPVYRVALRRALARTSAVLFQNEGAMAVLAEWFPEEQDRFVLVGSGVDVDGPVVRREPARALRVLHVARLHPSKGIAEFLDVARRCAGTFAEFVLVGPESPGQSRLLRDVRTAAAQGVIRYAGELGHDAIATEYARADVLYFPSHGEGVSRVMLEAGVAGLCPVVHEVAGVRELVAPGTGFVVAPGDSAAAAEVIAALAADRSLLRRRAEAYREHVVAGFSMAGFVDRFDAALAQAAAAAPAVPVGVVRRALDLAVAATVGAVTLPLWTAVALAIKLTSPGPVLYRAARAGQGGATFTLLKFRTMVHGPAGPAVTASGDRRVTPVGAILRRTKLDELPNLLNVLRGDMTMVGPRPEYPVYAARYSPAQREILRYRPGVVSPATIAYRYEEGMLAGAMAAATAAGDDGDVEAVYVEHVLPVKLAMDLEYFAQRTLRSDLGVLYRAARALMRPSPSAAPAAGAGPGTGSPSR
jgi:lipopolysaccharide/colanic/teichoic acid biosynthesis glycosyltransferase/glycosyltransferase involved in cell wall biosynthesis